MPIFLKNSLVQISKLSMQLLESWPTISVAKLNESLTAYLLVVKGSKIGT